MEGQTCANTLGGLPRSGSGAQGAGALNLRGSARLCLFLLWRSRSTRPKMCFSGMQIVLSERQL